MIQNKKVLAIIPARGGSKGLPDKNILPLGEKSLIGWTIEAALGASFIDRLVLSSDDNKISEVASIFGCEVPFVRPKELASDSASTAAVVNHALSSLDEEFDVVVLLQPTSPFRTSKHIDEAIKLMVEKNAKSLVSVVKINKSPEWMYWLDQKSMGISQILKGSVGNRRQESRSAYSLNGALYVIDVGLFREINGFICPGTVAYPMTETESLDIDTLEDFDFAKFILAGKNREL